MAAKKHPTAPIAAQPVATTTDCPIDIEGPGHERVAFAQSAVHQINLLIAELVDRQMSYDELEEDGIVDRTLLLRIKVLSDAASHLLSDPDDVKSIERSKVEVSRG